LIAVSAPNTHDLALADPKFSDFFVFSILDSIGFGFDFYQATASTKTNSVPQCPASRIKLGHVSFHNQIGFPGRQFNDITHGVLAFTIEVPNEHRLGNGTLG